MGGVVTADAPVRVLRMQGEVDIETAREWRPELTEAVGDTTTPLIVDLSRVTFLDSTGLGLLVQANSRLRRQGRPLVLVVVPDSPVARVLEATNLVAHFEIFGDPLAAEAAARADRPE